LPIRPVAILISLALPCLIVPTVAAAQNVPSMPPLVLTHVTVVEATEAQHQTSHLFLLASLSPFAKPQHSTPAAEDRIAFDSDRSGRFDIYVINSDGSNEQQLTRASKDQINVRPVWSPDCGEIAFTKLWTKPKHRSQLYIMAADGTAIRSLGRPPVGKNDWEPTWSPDAKEIAFVSDRDGSPDIYIMRADGSGTRRLIRIKEPGSSNQNPVWSPSGDAIAFDSNRTGIEEIYVLTIGSGQVRQLTHTASKGTR